MLTKLLLFRHAPRQSAPQASILHDHAPPAVPTDSELPFRIFNAVWLTHLDQPP